jgi:hypothetical protein
MAAHDEVVISHKDGRRYGVTVENFHAIYEEQGFKITHEADNSTPYVEPKAEKSATGAKEDKG